MYSVSEQSILVLIWFMYFAYILIVNPLIHKQLIVERTPKAALM